MAQLQDAQTTMQRGGACAECLLPAAQLMATDQAAGTAAIFGCLADPSKQAACGASETAGIVKCPDCSEDTPADRHDNLPCVLKAAGGANSTCGKCLAPYMKHGTYMMKDAIACMDMTAAAASSAVQNGTKIDCKPPPRTVQHACGCFALPPPLGEQVRVHVSTPSQPHSHPCWFRGLFRGLFRHPVHGALPRLYAWFASTSKGVFSLSRPRPRPRPAPRAGCRGNEPYSPHPEACSRAEYTEGADWAYHSRAGSTAASCTAACSADSNCTGFELANDGSYCAFYFNGACAGPAAAGWHSSSGYTTYVGCSSSSGSGLPSPPARPAVQNRSI